MDDKLRVLIEREVFEGRPLEIVGRLKEQAFTEGEYEDLGGYITWLAGNIRRLTGARIDARYGTLEEKAERIVQGLIGNGLLKEAPFYRDGQEWPEEDLMDKASGCPECGERRIDQLVFDDRDEITCFYCGNKYFVIGGQAV